MTSSACTALVVMCLVTPPVAGQTVAPAPLRHGEVSFAMAATTVNDFVGHAAVARAEFSGTELASVTGVVEVRVAEMRTGIGLRDSHMRNAMRADSFPTIRFELTGVAPGDPHGDTTSVALTGNLTIHGVTKAVRVPGTVVLHASGAEVTASFPVDMREYGIAPPSRFFGAVRVLPVTHVTAQLVFANQEH
jgi:polyisoprenoid-binding protein YceI